MPRSRSIANPKRGTQQKIMSSCSQACALATPTSALRSPRTPAITAPAVTAKYALTMIFTTAGGDRSIVSRCRSFSCGRRIGVARVEAADRQRERAAAAPLDQQPEVAGDRDAGDLRVAQRGDDQQVVGVISP